jgi:hypothetical protein
MVRMATWIWLNITLGILAFAAIGVVLPVLALRRPKEQRPAPAQAATIAWQDELADSRELAGVGA